MPLVPRGERGGVHLLQRMWNALSGAGTENLSGLRPGQSSGRRVLCPLRRGDGTTNTSNATLSANGPAPCPACGEVSDETARFCGGCGKDLGPRPEARTPPPTAPTQSTPSPPSPLATAQAKLGAAADRVRQELRGLSRRQIIAIVAAIVAVVLIGLGAVYGKRIVAWVRGPSEITVKWLVASGMSGDQPVPSVRFEYAPAQVTLYAGYAKARPNEDVIVMSVMNENGTIATECTAVTALYEIGYSTCPVTLGEGRYFYRLVVNQQALGDAPFRVIDGNRIRNLVMFAAVAQSVDSGKPAADTRVFYNGSSRAGLYVEYVTARGEPVQVDLLRDGSPFGNPCTGTNLQFGMSSYWCQFATMGPGNYAFRLVIDGIIVGEYPFTVSPDAPPPPPAAPRYCGMQPAWIFEPMCRDESLAQLNDRVLKLQSIFDMAGGTGDMFEKDRWQNDVRTRCFVASSQPECLRASLQARSDFLQAMIPEALSSGRPAFFRDQARQRWEQHDW